MINLVSEDAEEIMNQFSFLTSNITFKVCKTAEEYRNSQLMEDLDLCWIKILASPDYRTDLRNEAAAKIARQLSEIPFVSERLERPTNPKMEEAAKKMAREHRTIQQSFLKLVFYHFTLSCTTRENRILRDALGEDFYRLPVI